MSGLRVRQKADRHRRLLEAAMTLFHRSGYSAVRTEDIAAHAEVSVGTLYNYFATKGDLLLALVTMEVEEVLAQGAPVVDDPPRDLALALDRLVGVYFDHSLVYLTKDLWRTAMALTVSAPDTPFSARYTALDRDLAEQVTALVRALQVRGIARADVDPAALGQFVFNNLNQMFQEFVKEDAAEVADLKARVGRQHRALAAMLAGS
jgi:AcrR family transcriptional regulator